MKLIQAMKQVKDLLRKAEDIRGKIAANSASLDFETPRYGERQSEQVREWLQAHSDILKEILRLRLAIMRTNAATKVTIEIGDKAVVKTIAEWVYRRRELAELERQAWGGLTDRNLKEGRIQESTGAVREVKIRRYYDAMERDKNVELYRSEPAMIDGTLEVVNAVTDLIE